MGKQLIKSASQCRKATEASMQSKAHSKAEQNMCSARRGACLVTPLQFVAAIVLKHWA